MDIIFILIYVVNHPYQNVSKFFYCVQYKTLTCVVHLCSVVQHIHFTSRRRNDLIESDTKTERVQLFIKKSLFWFFYPRNSFSCYSLSCYAMSFCSGRIESSLSRDRLIDERWNSILLLQLSCFLLGGSIRDRLIDERWNQSILFAAVESLCDFYSHSLATV